jgi:hypothetical protein
MTRALIPATTLAPTKELENPPTAAEVVEVEFAAEEVLVVDPLTSWLAPERILALLLKVMSAHCSVSNQISSYLFKSNSLRRRETRCTD